MSHKAIALSVTQSARGLSLGALWQHLEVECRETAESLSQRKALFFALLRQLLTAGEVRLASNGVWLAGAVEQQLEQLAQAWPHPDSDDELDELDDTGLWFLAKAPAGLVWITPQGEEIWT